MSLNPTDVDEDQTIRQVLGGDAVAFGVLVQRHQQRLFSVMFAMLGNREDAEDVTQEAFAKAFVKLESFQGRSTFFTWLHRVAMNLAISHRRKHRREKSFARTPMEFAADAIPNRESAAEDRFADDEQTAQIRLAITQLDEERRSVLVLRDVDGMDYAAISDVLGIPIGTVRSRLHRARMDLKEIVMAFSPSLISSDEVIRDR